MTERSEFRTLEGREYLLGSGGKFQRHLMDTGEASDSHKKKTVFLKKGL